MAAADETTLSDPVGPLWYRGLAMKDAEAEAQRLAMHRPSPANIDDELGKVLLAYGAKRIVIGHTLKQVRWNRRKAAQILGVSYKTLLNKIKETGIEPP